MIGALAVLDRFSFEAALRAGPYRIVDSTGAPHGSVRGSLLRLAMHASVSGPDGSTLMEATETDRFSDLGRSLVVCDGDGGSIGSITRLDRVHGIRERWLVRNCVDEPVVVIDERGALRSALDQLWGYVGRRYTLHLPRGAEGTEVGEEIGTARRTMLGRRWDMCIHGDGDRTVDRRFVLAGMAVLAIDQL